LQIRLAPGTSGTNAQRKENAMKIENLQALFLHELKDAYDFEHRILEGLEEMEQAATAEPLQQAFRQHYQQTEGQIERLERVFAEIGEEPKRVPCDGIQGILEEGSEVAEAEGDPAAIDAALIAGAQRVEHYEISAYGSLRAFAEHLGYTGAVKLLTQNLDEESQTDEKLTRLAVDNINRLAAQGGRGGATKGEVDVESTTKEELYEEARELGVEGRSQMSKEELAEEVGNRR
jgi:ferritin-like metal-binding protein YciE